MPPVLVEERVRLGLEQLRLRRMGEVLDRVCEEASQANTSYLEFLDRLLEAEQLCLTLRNPKCKA